MIDLKMTKKQKKEASSAVDVDSPEYPFGTSLDFQKEQINKLPALKSADVGDKVEVHGIGKITSIHTSDSDSGDSHHSVVIQIQKIEIDTPNEEKKAFEED